MGSELLVKVDSRSRRGGPVPLLALASQTLAPWAQSLMVYALEQRHDRILGHIAHLGVGVFEIGDQLVDVALEGQAVVLVHLDDPRHGRLFRAGIAAAYCAVDAGVNLSVAPVVELHKQHRGRAAVGFARVAQVVQQYGT